MLMHLRKPLIKVHQKTWNSANVLDFDPDLNLIWSVKKNSKLGWIGLMILEKIFQTHNPIFTLS